MAESLCKKTPDVSTMSVVFAFKGQEPVTVRFSDFSHEIQQRLMLFGITEKVGNFYAGSKGSVATAMQLFDAGLENLYAGDWNAKADSSGGILAEALARKTGRDVLACRDRITEMSDDDKKALRKSLNVIIKTLELERAEARTGADYIDPFDM